MRHTLRTLTAIALIVIVAGCAGKPQRTAATKVQNPPPEPKKTAPRQAPAPTPKPSEPARPAPVVGKWIKLPSGLQYEDKKIGKGADVESGFVTVKYRGWLDNGKVFDKGTIPFALGMGKVITGWDQGIKGMRVGGVRELKIPPQLAYGENPPPGSPIPANATLHFEVELLKAE